MRHLLVAAGDRALTKFVAETLLGRKLSASQPALIDNGWDIARAHSGLEAMTLVTRGTKKYDAIVLDQHLPDRDVLKLLDELRSSDNSHDVPIFVMSERGRDQLTRRLASDNYLVAGFIDKPVTAETLRRGLRNLHRMRRVLVVESDLSQAEEYAKAMRRAGYAVDTETTGKTGLQNATENRPDAVVCALKLEDYTGVQLCVQLKRGTATHSIPVLLHGAHADLASSEIEENAHRADDFLGDPVTGEALVERLSSLVGRGPSTISSLPPADESRSPIGPAATEPVVMREAVQRGVTDTDIAPPWEDQGSRTPPEARRPEPRSPSARPKKRDPSTIDYTSTRPPFSTDPAENSSPSLPPASASPATRRSEAKRATRRVQCHLSVAYRHGETIYQSETLNISDGGILITTDRPIKIGTRIDLTLELPNHNEPITAVGKVAWVGKAPGGRDREGSKRMGVGLKFSKIDPEDLKKIVDYVNKVSRVVYIAP